MSIQENKAIVQRFYREIWNEGNLALAGELWAPDVEVHELSWAVPSLRGAEEAAQRLAGLRAAFPDLQLTVEHVVGEGDTVVARFSVRGTHLGEIEGIPPTGTQVELAGVNMFQLANGRIVELWVAFDNLGLMQQLGVVPVPEQVAA